MRFSIISYHGNVSPASIGRSATVRFPFLSVLLELNWTSRWPAGASMSMPSSSKSDITLESSTESDQEHHRQQIPVFKCSVTLTLFISRKRTAGVLIGRSAVSILSYLILSIHLAKHPLHLSLQSTVNDSSAPASPSSDNARK